MEGFENIDFLDKTAFSQKPDPEKEKELVERFKKGDLNAYLELRRAYEPYIMGVASRLPSNPGVSLAQIKARADAEFPKLLLKYDPEKAQLNTHLMSHLPGLMGNAVMDDMVGPHVPRTQQADLNRYRQARRTAEMEHGKGPTDQQIFHFFQEANPTKTWDDFLNAKSYYSKDAIGDVSMGADDEDGTLRLKDQHTGMSVFEDRDDPYRMLQIDRIQDIMRQHLKPEEFNVIKQYKIEGKPMSKVALENNISTTKLRSILDKWERIRKENNIQ